MFWACDSTHSWPGRHPLDPGARVPLALVEAERRAEGDVVPVAGGRRRAGPRSSGRRSWRGRVLRRRVDQRPVRDLARVLAGQVVDEAGVLDLLRRSASVPLLAIATRVAPASRWTVATGMVASPTYSISPPMPSLTTISAAAPAAAAASARSCGRDLVAALDDRRPCPWASRPCVVGRRAVAGVDGRHGVGPRCRGRCPAARGCRSGRSPPGVPRLSIGSPLRQRVVSMNEPCGHRLGRRDVDVVVRPAGRRRRCGTPWPVVVRRC